MEDVFKKQHEELMERVLIKKQQVLEMVFNKVTAPEGGSDMNIENFVKVSESLEKNIERVTKLKLSREKNAIDAEQGGNLLDVLRSLHEDDQKRLAGAVSEEEPTFTPEPSFSVDPQVKITGTDNQTYEEFLDRTKD